ncbi:MAG: phosphohistidine phosphatase SixA [Deltaproteobacteria bacterium]|nr:phosphohistidine phosphatase SixA [Deltaproteobacteria bacterium]
MKLYVVQTGEAVPKVTTDAERPLSDKGRRDIERMAGLLSITSMQAKRVIHSDVLRAKQTLEILRWAAAPSRPALEARSGLGPQDPVEPWVREIETWTEDTVIVCHFPFVNRLVTRLLTGREEPRVIDFVPGTAVCLTREETGWCLCWMIPPAAAAGLGRY